MCRTWCRSIARDREDRRKASAEQERLESTGMDPERAAKEAAAITNQGTRRRTKPPSLVLLDAATEEAMKKEAVLKRQLDKSGAGRGKSASGKGGTPSTGASRNPQKRLKTETGAAATRTAAAGAGLGALLQRERERNRAAAAQDDRSGGGAPEKSKSAGAQNRPSQQPDHNSLRTDIRVSTVETWLIAVCVLVQPAGTLVLTS